MGGQGSQQYLDFKATNLGFQKERNKRNGKIMRLLLQNETSFACQLVQNDHLKSIVR